MHYSLRSRALVALRPHSLVQHSEGLSGCIAKDYDASFPVPFFISLVSCSV
jgi:hypothetical protein